MAETETHRFGFRLAFNHLLQTSEEKVSEAGMVSALWTDTQEQMAKLYLEELGLSQWQPDRFLSGLNDEHREALLRFQAVVEDHIKAGLASGELREEDAVFARDLSNLRRYLVARDFNIDKALKMLQGSLKWRATTVRCFAFRLSFTLSMMLRVYPYDACVSACGCVDPLIQRCAAETGVAVV